MEDPGSPASRHRNTKIDVQQNNHNGLPAEKYTILVIPNEVLGLSLSYLGTGDFGFISPVCKRFKSAYLTYVTSEKKITTGRSLTSSISRVEKYLGDAGTDNKQIAFFWHSAARYGHVNLMEWAYERGYARFWKEREEPHFFSDFIGKGTCRKAAAYGQLDALKWLHKHGCEWDIETCAAAARGGHLFVLQWARESGCEWNSATCTAAEGGHLYILQWARENGCDWNSNTCSGAAAGGHLSVLKWLRANGCK